MYKAGRKREEPTRSTKRSTKDRWGIVIVIAAHFNMALSMGLARSYGVFYISWRDEFQTSAKKTAAVQSIVSTMASFTLMIGGVLTKRYGCRRSGIIGGLVTSLGLFGTFWVKNIQQLYIAAAVTGGGVGISYNSILVIVAMYFKTKYKTAHAIAFSGTGTGVIVCPLVLQLIMEQHGWRGAALIASALTMHAVVLSSLFRPTTIAREFVFHTSSEREQGAPVNEVRASFLELNLPDPMEIHSEDSSERQERLPQEHRLKPKATFTHYLNSLMTVLGFKILLKSYRFSLLFLLNFENTIAFLGFLQFIIPRAESVDVTPSTSAFLLSLFGIGNLIGRLGNGFLISWKISAENVVVIGIVLAGLSSFLASVDNYIAMATSSFVYGFTMGFLLAIAVILIRNYVGLSNLSVALGLVGMSSGLGVLAGPVMAGWLLDMTQNYKLVFYVFGATHFICALQMLLMPVLKRLEPGLDTNASNQ